MSMHMDPFASAGAKAMRRTEEHHGRALDQEEDASTLAALEAVASPKFTITPQLRKFVSDYSDIYDVGNREVKWKGEVREISAFGELLHKAEDTTDDEELFNDAQQDKDLEAFKILPGDSQAVRFAKRYKQDLIMSTRVYGISCNLWDNDDPFRLKMLAITRSMKFEMTVLVMVLAWCFSLAVKPVPTESNPDPDFRSYEILNILLAVLFTVEAALRIIVMGFIQPRGAFLRNGYHILDTVVIVSMWVEQFAFQDSWGISLAPLRVFRLFVPLRLFRRFQGIKAILGALRLSVKPLGSVVLAMLFFFVAYSILCTQTYGLSLRRRCVTDEKPVYSIQNPNVIIGTIGGQDLIPTRWCFFDEGGGEDASGPSNCPAGTTCKLFKTNPLRDFAGFDNFGTAMMSLFSIHALDGHIDIFLLPLLEGGGEFPLLTWTTFILIFLLVSVMGVNLFVAVIINTFTQLREDSKEAIFSSTKINAHPEDDQLNQEALAKVRAEHEAAAKTITLADGTVIRPDGTHVHPDHADHSHGSTRGSKDGSTHGSKRGEAEDLDYEKSVAVKLANTRQGYTAEAAGEVDPEELAAKAHQHEPEDPDYWKQWPAWRQTTRKFVLHNYFEFTVVGVIVLNTIGMAVEHEGQSQGLTDILNYAEYFFTVFFSLELILKFIAVGVVRFLKVGSNAFDAFIVLMSIVSTVISDTLPAISNVSVLRMFRVTRLLRVVRRVKSLWVLLQTVLHSMEAVANMLFFMVFTGLAFAIIGKELFGGEIDTGIRARFDNIPQAIMTLFAVTTGDNWGESMVGAMVGTDATDDRPKALKTVQVVTAALYFMGFYIWSNYVVLNLLIACMLENFAIDQLDVPEGDDDLHLIATSEVQDETGCWRWFKIPPVIGEPAQRIVRKPAFEYVYVFFTIVSSIFMCLGGPPGREDIVISEDIIDVADIIFTVIFGIECILKVCADAKWYFNNAWDRLDFMVLIITIIDFVSRGMLPKGARVLRAFRIIRALKVVGKNEEMKAVIAAVLDSLGTLGYVVVLFFILTIMFAILGRGVFGGRFWRCNDPFLEYPMGKVECYGTFRTLGGLEEMGRAMSDDSVDPDAVPGVLGLQFLMPRAWENDPVHFDNVIDAFFALFRCLLLQWTRINAVAMDVTARDMQPKYENQPAATLFIMTFIFFARFFVATLFVTVVIEFYNRAQEHSVLTLKQSAWKHTLEVQVPRHFWKHFPPPKNKLRKWMFDRVRDKSLKNLMGLLVLCNILFMSFNHSPSKDWYSDIVPYVDTCFVALFFLEVCFKVVAVGVPVWKKRMWFQFEAFLVLGSVVSLAPEYLMDAPWAIVVGRLFRILRVTRLVNFEPRLQDLVITLYHAILPIANVVVLAIIVNGIFAVVGVSLLGNVRTGIYQRWHNFETFGYAMGTLFRCTAEDAIDVFMVDSAVSPPYCTLSDESIGLVGDCGTWAALLYFMLNSTISMFIILNVLIAVIINHFRTYYQQLRTIGVIPASNLEEFRAAWLDIDPDFKGHIALRQVWQLFSTVTISLRGEVCPFGRKAQGLHWQKCVRTELLLREFRAGRLEPLLQLDKAEAGSNDILRAIEMENIALRSSKRSKDKLVSQLTANKKKFKSDKVDVGDEEEDLDSDYKFLPPDDEDELEASTPGANASLTSVNDIVSPTQSAAFSPGKSFQFKRDLWVHESAINAEKKKAKAKLRLQKDLRRMERLLNRYDGGGQLPVSYHTCLMTALSWAVDPTFYPNALKRAREDVVSAVGSHVTVLNFAAMFKAYIHRFRTRKELRATALARGEPDPYPLMGAAIDVVKKEGAGTIVERTAKVDEPPVPILTLKPRRPVEGPAPSVAFVDTVASDNTSKPNGRGRQRGVDPTIVPAAANAPPTPKSALKSRVIGDTDDLSSWVSPKQPHGDSYVGANGNGNGYHSRHAPAPAPMSAAQLKPLPAGAYGNSTPTNSASTTDMAMAIRMANGSNQSQGQRHAERRIHDSEGQAVSAQLGFVKPSGVEAHFAPQPAQTRFMGVRSIGKGAQRGNGDAHDTSSHLRDPKALRTLESLLGPAPDTTTTMLQADVQHHRPSTMTTPRQGTALNSPRSLQEAKERNEMNALFPERPIAQAPSMLTSARMQAAVAPISSIGAPHVGPIDELQRHKQTIQREEEHERVERDMIKAINALADTSALDLSVAGTQGIVPASPFYSSVGPTPRTHIVNNNASDDGANTHRGAMEALASMSEVHDDWKDLDRTMDAYDESIKQSSPRRPQVTAQVGPPASRAFMPPMPTMVAVTSNRGLPTVLQAPVKTPRRGPMAAPAIAAPPALDYAQDDLGRTMDGGSAFAAYMGMSRGPQNGSSGAGAGAGAGDRYIGD